MSRAVDPQSGTPKTLWPSDPRLELRPRVEAKAGTWRWGRAGSKDRVWGGDVLRVRLREQTQSQAGRRWGRVMLAAPMGRRSVPKGKKRGRILCFQITAGRCPCLLLLGTADKEKALAEFNLIWALGAYQVILFPSRRVLLLPALDLLSSTWSVHTVTARPLMPRP